MTDDWFELLIALLDTGSRFVLVGAHALAVHGVPSGTQDLDVWIDPDPSNTPRVWAALATFGAPTAALGITEEDLQRPGSVVQLGVAPNRIDLMTTISGVPSLWPMAIPETRWRTGGGGGGDCVNGWYCDDWRYL